jgi:HEAT repeat protein
MTRKLLFIVCFASMLTGLQADSIHAQDLRTRETRIADMLALFPASGFDQRDSLAEEILSMGADGIEALCDMLVPAGEGDDASIRYALNGTTVYAARPGAESQRLLVSRALIQALKRADHSQVKAFLIRQLRIAGREEAVSALAVYLSDPAAAEPSLRALTAIGGPEAERLILKALPRTETSQIPAFMQALGLLRSERAVKSLQHYANRGDIQTRQTAQWALANTGAASSEKLLKKTWENAPREDKNRSGSNLMLFARRRFEAGDKKTAGALGRLLLKSSSLSGDQHQACAALTLLTEIRGGEALPLLIEAAESPLPQLQGKALELAKSIPGKDATRAWLPLLDRAAPETRANLVAFLGKRGDRLALERIKSYIRDTDDAVRSSALLAMARLGGDDVLPDLITALKQGRPDDVNAVKTALLTYTDGTAAARVAPLLPDLPPVSRIAVLDILAARDADEYLELISAESTYPDEKVRIAALKAMEKLGTPKELPLLVERLLHASTAMEIHAAQNAVVSSASRLPDPDTRTSLLLSTLEQTAAENRGRIISILPRLGGDKALDATIAAYRNELPDLKKTAVATLARWPDIQASAELLRIGQTAGENEHRTTALNGYVRLILNSDKPDEEKLTGLKTAMKSARSIEEKSRILSGAGKIRTLDGLLYVAGYLEDPELGRTAAYSAIQIACPQTGSDPGLTGLPVLKVLKKVTTLPIDPYSLKQAEQHLNTLRNLHPSGSSKLNQPPEGFIALFNGKDLSGWKGLAGEGGNPLARARMSPGELTAAQAAADSLMRAHWSAQEGILTFDGKGSHLCTRRDYGDFELWVDWKIEPGGDSGIYLRGSPQVQIWDTAQYPEGSGGLYNNQKNPAKPLIPADNPVGQWNTFHILMKGERVTVDLNGRRVVDNTVMENYWDRNRPIFPSGQIELQSHGSRLFFRNIFIREILREEEWTKLFNGEDFSGWTGATDSYYVQEGKIVCPRDGGGNLYTEDEFGDFHLRFEFKLTPGANNGLGIRVPLEGDAAYVGMELQILDNTALIYQNLKPYQYHGSVYGVIPALRGHLRPLGEWNLEEVIARGPHIRVILNGVPIVDGDIDRASRKGTIDGRKHPGLKRKKGHIGFLGHGSHVEFRNIYIKELN